MAESDFFIGLNDWLGITQKCERIFTMSHTYCGIVF